MRGIRRMSAAGSSAAALLLLSLAAPPCMAAGSADIPDLLEARRCGACHALTGQLIGPPYQAIALRHAGRAAVMTEVLAQKIILGGGGNWGVVPMVPNEHVTADEARAMARWILELKVDGK